MTDTWPPTERQLLEAHGPSRRGVPVFSPELCEPLVKKGWLVRVNDPHCQRYDITACGLTELTQLEAK
ncbi:MAG: hypothetical protein ACR2RE_09080 [Geminicoccaceae bacterium]